jgi:hypothetical protein
MCRPIRLTLIIARKLKKLQTLAMVAGFDWDSKLEISYSKYEFR